MLLYKTDCVPLNIIQDYVYLILCKYRRNFQRSCLAHSINIRKKYHLYSPTAKIWCFRKSKQYVGIRVFHGFPCRLTRLTEENLHSKYTQGTWKHTLFNILMNFLFLKKTHTFITSCTLHSKCNMCMYMNIVFLYY
jgi:hypothetical protein